MYHFIVYFIFMKLAGITGTGSGKLGSTVFSVSGGEQVVRQYQPTVGNPSTEGQVSQRAKLKLMSQLSAAFAAVLAFQKSGLVSARNQFSSKNIGLCTVSDGVVSINLEGIQLTPGNRGISAVVVSRDGATAINVALAADCAKVCDRVVYIAMVKNDENSLQLLDSKVCETAGANGLFEDTLAPSNKEVVVYAYGIKDASAAAAGKYANYSVTSGTDIASLVASRAISTADFAFTKTVGATLAAQV